VAKDGINTTQEADHKGTIAQKIERNKFYFQYRIDELNEEQVNPKICIGVCDEGFLINEDLSR